MDSESVAAHLVDFQRSVCGEFENIDAKADFPEDLWQQASGQGCSRVVERGEVFEKAGVNYSRVWGECLPPAATAAHPRLAGKSFEAMGVSIVSHPVNPYVPTAHCNLRFFLVRPGDAAPVWWFGGGYDLTPCYPFREDVMQWHRAARDACEPFGKDVYSQYKRWCDEYFFIRHRGETRGVGGLFFDDLNQWGFAKSFAFIRSVGDSFLSSYAMIVKRRQATPYGEREKQFQLYRRGRYVEFNLVYDRGTLFGLQSQGRVESILMSLPPRAEWHYDWKPRPGSPEEDLYSHYLKPQQWLEEPQ